MRRQAGFTLLEIVLAMALLGIGLVAVLGLLNRSLRLYGTAQELREDVEMASGIASSLSLPAGPLREQAEQELLERHKGRSFRLQSQPTLHPEVQQVEIQIYRGTSREPSYKLVRFTEAREAS